MSRAARATLLGIGLRGLGLLACGGTRPGSVEPPPAPPMPMRSTAVDAAPREAEPPTPKPASSGWSLPTGGPLVADATGDRLAAFVRAHAERGTWHAAPMAGNGGRDVALYLPPDPDPARPVRLVYHFHGTYSERMAEPRSGAPKKEWVGWTRLEQTLAAIDELQRAGEDNVVLVYPLSAGKRLEPEHRGWSNVMYDRMWMLSASQPGYRDDFDALHREVVGALTGSLGIPADAIARGVTVEGHSAGGIALRNVAQTVSDTEVREYIFLDASFQSWADGCHLAVTKAGAKSLVTLVITDRGMADPYGKRDPWCTTTPLLLQRFGPHRATCNARPELELAGFDLSCAELTELQQEWDGGQQAWCEAMRDDMRAWPAVYVHRTRVPHGEQPRHFSGGLGLPPERFRP